MTRLADWDGRLSATIMEWRERPFRWDSDCARWVAACVIAQTGEDPLSDLRGQYRTEREALKLLAAKPMPEYLDERFPRVHPAQARRGDIALAQENCLGIVIAGDALFFVDGVLAPIARAEWQGTWGVGRDG
ncbi:DUF6950 family protein [Qipengyuania pacifica]|uniref:DUF6950 family protein n=1 Tax=Qipengyuania pacifica TaxID=2860199 RepID=UPI001C9DA080|nr:hypothetical protein [Qipengyuania pacifica]MBY8335212.1 hypothetical protein [Qipengyuania pacifica]